MSVSNEQITGESSGIAMVAEDARSAAKEVLNGPAMRKLSLARRSAFLQLKSSGQLKPATVINFNPVSLLVDDGHVPWRVPSATGTNKKPVKVEWNGKNYTGALLTVREPSCVPWIRDVKPPADDSGDPTPDYDIHYILPIELMDQYRMMYNDETGQMKMGGVLVFEGDLSTFHKAAKDDKLLVPRFVRLPNNRRAYYTEEVSLKRELDVIFRMQKDYCEAALQAADEYNQDEQARKNITPVHREWARYSMAMGWKEAAPDWMSAKFDSEESCRGCGKPRPAASKAHFCVCGRPYNAFDAFMAGEPVAESYLLALPDDQVAKVMKEVDRRAKLKAKHTPKPVIEPKL